LEDDVQAARLQKILFGKGILMDICGYRNNVLKIMPPITITADDLGQGLEIIYESLLTCLKTKENNAEAYG
jgi:diaminobutyrate-2-oxoglutarate transaminase